MFPGAAATFDGLRIVQLSDIHLGTIVSPGRELTRLADRVNALRPDLVLFTGDLVNIRASELDSTAVQLLRRIEAPVYSVTGNHDVGKYIKDSLRHPAAESLREVIARQRAMGWRVLDDETVYLRRGGDSIALTGLSFDPALSEQRHDRHLPATGDSGAPSQAFRRDFTASYWHTCRNFGSRSRQPDTAT